MLLKACLNGARRPTEHARLPVTAAETAADVARTAAAGAHAVHLHVKDAEGRDTLDGPALAAVLEAARAAVPGIPVGATTGAWAATDPAARIAAIRTWTGRPDFASVNWHEDGAADVATVLLRSGIGVEAGLWHADAVEAWLGSPLRDRCLRVLVELPDGLDEASTVGEADRLLAILADGGNTRPVLLHGEGSSCWPALRHAARLGLGTRIGLEDVLELPDGTPAPDNASLVAAARRVIAAAARESQERPSRASGSTSSRSS